MSYIIVSTNRINPIFFIKNNKNIFLIKNIAAGVVVSTEV
jgi:hypothetical protein